MIFPPEIIEHTSEAHFAKNNKPTRIIYMLVLLAIVTALALTPFIKVDVTVQSRGIIRSQYENNTVQAAVYGEIQNINIATNQAVIAGDTLLVVSTKKLDEQIHHIHQKLQENNQFVNDIQAILTYQPDAIQTAKYRGEYNGYLAQLREQQVQSNFLKHEKQTADQLFAKDVIPNLEYLKANNNYDTAIKRERVLHDQFHSKLMADKAQLENHNRELLSQKEQLAEEKEMYVICAPTNGTIMQHQGLQVGNFITPNQTIAQISPSSKLMAECYISPSDIGYFKQGMNVNFQLDAFNYNQWGLAHGKVTSISEDIVLVNEQPVFRAQCQLKEKHLLLKNGYKGQLKKGMTLTGRFYLTQRTLYQLTFDKVDNWLNPKLVTKD